MSVIGSDYGYVVNKSEIFTLAFLPDASKPPGKFIPPPGPKNYVIPF